MANIIVVVGAGVSGLTSALLLSKSKANAVTVIAKHMPGDYDVEYASPWAGANFLPMSTRENSRWERRTWPEIKRLAEEVPEAGIHFQTSRIFRREKDMEGESCPTDPMFDRDPWFQTVMPDYRDLSAAEMPTGHDSGCEFRSVCINTAMYLYWLVGQCLRNGVVFKRCIVTHISDAKHQSHEGKEASMVVNATGLGSRKLGGVQDESMAPSRGQTVLVRNELHPMFTTSGTEDGTSEILYTMQRPAGGGTILGGTYDIGNWESVPDPNIALRIMRRIVDMCPEIAGGKGIEGLSVVRHAAGLRPYRTSGVRVEKEKLGDGTWIVHNYGHAGWGYQGSYGCAERVVELVNEIRRDNGEDLTDESKDTTRLQKARTRAAQLPGFVPASCDPHDSYPGGRSTMVSPDEPLYKQARRFALDVTTGRHALSKLIPIALWLGDAVLCGLIIWRIPYTEIDWVAYMEQISQFVSGERDYTKMEGGTGPLVYPAAHVYTYTGLYYLTDRGENLLLAQQLFAALYMATLAVVMLCYWKAKVPPYIFPLLILSKRLHSVFVLRCFNDCFAAFFFWLAIWFFQNRQWTLGSIAYSWGLGIKMSLLLSLPAVAVVLFLGRGLGGSLRLAFLMAQMQVAMAIPFLSTNWKGYVGRAFELSRQFKFEWTVNWRMLGQETFLSKRFALALLTLHALVLLLFITTRWLQPANRSLPSLVAPLLRGRLPLGRAEELRVSSRVTPEYVATTILSANVIGLLFARSLHYQFYAYLAWATPYLLWKAWPSVPVVYLLWGVQEAAWNTFPSTDLSSTAAVNVLLATVVLVYFGTLKPVKSGDRKVARETKKKT